MAKKKKSKKASRSNLDEEFRKAIEPIKLICSDEFKRAYEVFAFIMKFVRLLEN